MGYGTKEHREALLQLGVSPIHRMSYSPMSDLNLLKEQAKSQDVTDLLESLDV